MNSEKYNEKAINDVYKNARLAMQSIKDLIPSVKNDALKNEMSEEYESYKKAAQTVADFMKKNNIEKEEVNFFQKAGMWCGIKMKTMFGVSKNQVAEMMMKGTTNGINELTAMKNESQNLDEGIKEKVLYLLKLEEGYMEKLKKYL